MGQSLGALGALSLITTWRTTRGMKKTPSAIEPAKNAAAFVISQRIEVVVTLAPLPAPMISMRSPTDVPGPRQNLGEWVLEFFVGKARDMAHGADRPRVVRLVASLLATFFQHGEFAANDVLMTRNALVGYMPQTRSAMGARTPRARSLSVSQFCSIASSRTGCSERCSLSTAGC